MFPAGIFWNIHGEIAIEYISQQCDVQPKILLPTSNSKDKSMWMAKGQRLLPIPVYIINDCGQASHCMPLSVAGVYCGRFIILPFLLSLRDEKDIIQIKPLLRRNF